MMYLLDTCALLWFMDDSSALSQRAKDVIGKSETLYISIAAFWEIAIKKTIGKLDIAESIFEIRDICDNYGIVILPIKIEYLGRIQTLPRIHNDPFDRLMIATALEENLPLITHDSNIGKYDISTYW